MSKFKYKVFPTDHILSEYVPLEIIDDVKFKESFIEVSEPLHRDPELGFDRNAFAKGIKEHKDRFLLILTNPTEPITLRNTAVTQSKARITEQKDDNKVVIRETDQGLLIDDKQLVPVVQQYFLGFDIRYVLFETLKDLDLISNDVRPQYYGSIQTVTPDEVKDGQLHSLTDFAEICELFRNRKVPYRINNKYIEFLRLESFDQKIKIKTIVNQYRDTQGIDIREKVGPINTVEDIDRAVGEVGGAKLDLFLIRDGPRLGGSSFYCLAEHKMLHRLFVNSVLSLHLLRSGGNLLIRSSTGYLQTTAEIFFMLTSMFENAYIYRPSTDRPTSKSRFLAFKNFKGMSDNQRIVLRSIVSRWYTYDPDMGSTLNVKKQTSTYCLYDPYNANKNTQKFVSKLLDFSVPIPISFYRWIKRSNEDILDIFRNKWDQTEKLEKVIEKESKANVEILIDEIMKKNIEYSINWCHVHGIPVNRIYEDGDDRLLTHYDYMMRIFPKESGVNLNDLQVSNEGLYSVSRPRDAEAISKIIMRSMDQKASTLTITDGTANIGGNVINFAKYFKFVNAVEISPFQCRILQHNVNVYKRKNVKIECKNYTDVLRTLKQDIVFLDPPWGGLNYKSMRKLTLYLSGIPLEDIVNKLQDKAKLIVIKVPLNYDFQSFFRNTQSRTFTVYKIRNYMILVIRTRIGSSNGINNRNNRNNNNNKKKGGYYRKTAK
jgi:16S rRNA G966 N2-methylase RsmD